jgi:flagellar basal-body rod protein FlgF
MSNIVRPTGMQHAAAALQMLERRQEVLANNLANVSTTGFKGERVFSELLSGGLPTVRTATDTRVGALISTGAPLDLAITGDGFFVVATPAGERLTRGGAFQLNDERQMVDAEGHALLGEENPQGGTRGPVTIPAGAAAVNIDRSGTVIVDGKQIARLRFESVPADTALQHEGGGLFAAPQSRARVAPGDRTVSQGAQEESNVNSLESMVDLISVQRAYASAQKVMTTIDAARGLCVTEIGRPS